MTAPASSTTPTSFLETILTSLRAGVVVLNPELQVQVWNRQAEELWGLRPEEAVGQHFLNLDIGLPTDRLRSVIRRILGGEDGPQEVTVPAVNRRGRSIELRVLGTALSSAADDAAGAILTMEGGRGAERHRPRGGAGDRRTALTPIAQPVRRPLCGTYARDSGQIALIGVHIPDTGRFRR